MLGCKTSEVIVAVKQKLAYQHNDTSKPPGPLLTETLSPASNLQANNKVVTVYLAYASCYTLMTSNFPLA